eukprot:CAMPEP_0206138816 /NCGR_PEP_ID=MMETSP1473-20131121/3710_1 /ASSEMBLY_ACC=CAM_ASM_001109 /TAXON_ID=1461547 /ORGANISM="Stichococcus sp, Strain RCC1054" /LENGTH=99 /DNA_ID=CAMNT_0053532343 /DNA_START=170 /DNA_END=469 /DNA_ORIENTATION=+
MSPRPFKWVRPEVSPLFAAIGLAVGICGYSVARNLMTNPAVYVRKERRSNVDDTGSDAMKKQSNSYGTGGLFRNFGHVHGKPEAWKSMQAREEAAAAKT